MIVGTLQPGWSNDSISNWMTAYGIVALATFALIAALVISILATIAFMAIRRGRRRRPH